MALAQMCLLSWTGYVDIYSPMVRITIVFGRFYLVAMKDCEGLLGYLRRRAMWVLYVKNDSKAWHHPARM